jgi:hypothetical protein
MLAQHCMKHALHLSRTGSMGKQCFSGIYVTAAKDAVGREKENAAASLMSTLVQAAVMSRDEMVVSEGLVDVHNALLPLLHLSNCPPDLLAPLMHVQAALQSVRNLVQDSFEDQEAMRESTARAAATLSVHSWRLAAGAGQEQQIANQVAALNPPLLSAYDPTIDIPGRAHNLTRCDWPTTSGMAQHESCFYLECMLSFGCPMHHLQLAEAQQRAHLCLLSQACMARHAGTLAYRSLQEIAALQELLLRAYGSAVAAKAVASRLQDDLVAQVLSSLASQPPETVWESLQSPASRSHPRWAELCMHTMQAAVTMGFPAPLLDWCAVVAREINTAAQVPAAQFRKLGLQGQMELQAEEDLPEEEAAEVRRSVAERLNVAVAELADDANALQEALEQRRAERKLRHAAATVLQVRSPSACACGAPWGYCGAHNGSIEDPTAHKNPASCTAHRLNQWQRSSCA